MFIDKMNIHFPLTAMVTESTDSDEADVNKATVLHAVGIALGIVVCKILVVFVAFIKREWLGMLND
jgi:hypothetical protein